MKGKLSWFDGLKGYGFIDGDDGKSYFIHHTKLPKDLKISENDRIEFDIEETDKGNQAVRIRKL